MNIEKILRIINVVFKKTIIPIIILLFLSACSGMKLSKYPGPSNISIQNTKVFHGVQIISEPLLDQKINNECFGVDLLEKGILAVYLSFKNENTDKSFLLSVDTVQLINSVGNKKAEKTEYEPQLKEEKYGQGKKALRVIFPLFFEGPFGDGLFKQSSKNSIIVRNLKEMKLKNTTIEPGEIVSGLSYFSNNTTIDFRDIQVCFELMDMTQNQSYPVCIPISINR